MLGRVGGDFGRMGLVRPAGHLAGASLDLNFVASSGYPAAPSLLLTTTRSSSGDYADNSAGVWSSFAANIPRITDKGLLVEESRTNSIRNNSMQGAVVGVIGSGGALPTNWSVGGGTGLTTEVVSIGTQNGIDYLDLKISGVTGSISFGLRPEGNAATVAASSGQIWTYNSFVALAGGTVSNISAISLNTSGFTAGVVQNADNFVSSSILGTIASSLDSASRTSLTSTLADATTASIRSQLLLTYSSGVAIDITLRIGWPQLELGAFATSPIRTTSAAATRAADVVTVTTPPALVTLFIQYNTPVAGVSRRLLLFGRAADNNYRIDVLINASNVINPAVVDASVVQASLNNGTYTAGTRAKLVVAAATDDFASVLNGGSVVTDTSGTVPSALDKMTIGATGSGAAQLGGFIERLAVFPTRLTNAQLQAITAP